MASHSRVEYRSRRARYRRPRSHRGDHSVGRGRHPRSARLHKASKPRGGWPCTRTRIPRSSETVAGNGSTTPRPGAVRDRPRAGGRARGAARRRVAMRVSVTDREMYGRSAPRTSRRCRPPDRDAKGRRGDRFEAAFFQRRQRPSAPASARMNARAASALAALVTTAVSKSSAAESRRAASPQLSLPASAQARWSGT